MLIFNINGGNKYAIHTTLDKATQTYKEKLNILPINKEKNDKRELVYYCKQIADDILKYVKYDAENDDSWIDDLKKHIENKAKTNALIDYFRRNYIIYTSPSGYIAFSDKKDTSIFLNNNQPILKIYSLYL